MTLLPRIIRHRAAAMVREPIGTRRPVARLAWSRVTRLGFALAVLFALGVPAPGVAASSHDLALFPSASSPHWEGFARIINHSDEPGVVHIVGIDDTGSESGPIELRLEARATAHFSSGDLERGNAQKGLSDGLGAGEGDWRLRLQSDLDIEALSYIRTGDGFVTPMHQRAPAQGSRHHVRFFNPGSNHSQVSRLRLINPTGADVEVTITGRDDEGESAPGGEVRLTLGAGQARTLTAQALESGGEDLAGSLGDGAGKWQLFVSAAAPIEVMSLLASPTGHLANLSAPGLRDVSEGRREHELPLFLPASDPEREGFARIINHSDEPGVVHIVGIDDTGSESGPVTVTLAAGAGVHFNSRDVEEGNLEKGLSGALGEGSGSWRLRLYTELDIESLAYVRTADGFVTPMHERVRESAMRHHVALFNPGSNRLQASRLRLINPTEAGVEVTITGRDDEGESAPGGEVRLTLAAGQARTLTASALESGGEDFSGSLGDGAGKWQLFVFAAAPIEVMSLLESPTGHLANLSASSLAGVVSEEGIDQPVALDVIVTIPPEVTTVEASDLTTTVLGSQSDGVPPGGAPALLVASDADGAVMYALANEDGGLLGEEAGTVRVSVGSTAVVLVALAAGYRIPSLTAQVVDAILSHPDYGGLTRQLARLMGVDKSYLGRLSDYPDVVALVQRMAVSLTGGGGRAAMARASRSADAARSSALPDGIVKEDFYCTPLTGWPCSPWDEHEPWRWFGNAKGAEAYLPDGTSWTDWFQTIVLTPAFEGYWDFLEEATYPPFLARSDDEDARAVHAAAAPGFTGYAMELYEGSRLRDWYYVPGNTTTVDKLLNSGAAFREVLAGDGRILGPHIDRIRFQRYRLTAAAAGGLRPDSALVVSFLNTFHLLSSIANVATDFSAVDEWLNDMATDPSLYLHIASCASALLPERYLETSDPNDSAIEQMLAFVRSTPKHLPGILLGPCRELVLKVGGEALVNALGKLISRAALDALVSTLTGVKPVFDLANDAVPGAVSYFAPSAARSEYHVQWERTRGGQAYIAQVSEKPLPVAEFTYAQQRRFRVELNGSRSQGEGLRYEWAVGGARIGTGEKRVHDFGEAGAFEVTLTVTDRNGVTAAERGRVRVTSGRVPVVSSLTCTPTGEGKAFSMHAELSDADDDIDSVQWFSHLSKARPDEVTEADRSRVTLSAPGGASHTRAKVRVVDARGNEAERSCAVELDPGPPLPRISGASAEEGEALEFTVTLDRAPAEGVTYYYATYRGTTGSADYDGHLATALRFGAGERSKTLTVRTTEDTRVERDETFHVYVTDSTRALTAGAPARYLARATGVIRDDDELEESAPLPRISEASAEEGEALEFTVTLDRAPAEGVTYYYATYRGTAGSADYDGHLATALRFGAGERSKTLTVRTTEDTRVERDETFHVYVTDSARALTASAPARYLARATGVIRDDDADATDACTGPTVSIPDAMLRAAVERVLGKARGASITPEEMRGLNSLPTWGSGIESLTGLQCATGLEVLYLHNNQLSDLTPLAGLTALETLWLQNNQLSDLTPLAGLTALKWLVLDNNQLSDLTPLAGLTALYWLNLDNNQLSDLTPLAGLTALDELWLQNNQLSDLTPLAGLTALDELYLYGNQLSDLTPLAGLTALGRLNLSNNQLSDLTPLAGLTALDELNLSNNQLSDLTPLAGLTALGRLNLSNNQLSDLTPLAGLTALRGLYLENNQISDIVPLVLNAGLDGYYDYINLKANPLSDRSRDVHIPALRARGVRIDD